MDQEKLDEAVCSWDSACIIILIIHLQTKPMLYDYDDVDPVITVNFASATNIHNCLSLGTLGTVGQPGSGVPSLSQGMGSTTI